MKIYNLYPCNEFAMLNVNTEWLTNREKSVKSDKDCEPYCCGMCHHSNRPEIHHDRQGFLMGRMPAFYIFGNCREAKTEGEYTLHIK